MNSVFEEIEKLRNGSSLNLIESLSNRYTVCCQEPNRTKTAYCFSIPIRNSKTNNIVDLHFYHSKNGSSFVGSDAKIIITDKVYLVNEYGRCDIIFPGTISKKTKETVYFTNNNHHIEIHPILNGMMIIMDCGLIDAQPQIMLRFDRFFESIRTNNKYFSVMRDKFIPFVTVSCIGTINAYGKILAPCEVHNQKVSDLEYVLTFCTANKSKNRIAIEINMQEPKLFQDTTVESHHPKLNNAFGGTSFLGTSKAFGEQWLYSRLDISNISHLQGKKIIKSILHIPQLGYNISPITVSKISERFCSFGSNWENKIAMAETIAVSSESNGYYHLDMTKLLGNFRKKSENFVIRGNGTNKPVIIPTGDSFFAPQILEVRYQ